MNAMTAYLNEIAVLISQIEEKQSANLEEGAQMLCAAVLSGKHLFTFGCGHAALVALEMYYRSGGMALFNPVRAPGLCLDIDPATMTSEMERLPQYGRMIMNNQSIGEGDVIIIHSVSGRNPVPLDAAIGAKEKGAKVIALTNMAYSSSAPSRHQSGKRLFEVADLVLDNGGCIGDGAVRIPGVPEKVGPTSTVIGAAMLNAMMCRMVELITMRGGVPPVFVSANIQGGDEHNHKMLEAYKEHIFYMG